MGLTGASSNQDSTVHDRLVLLNSTRARILNQAGSELAWALPTTPVKRPPAVRRSVRRVLLVSGRPMRASEVETAVAELLGVRVARSSVKSALSDLAADDSESVSRIARGVYRAHDSFRA